MSNPFNDLFKKAHGAIANLRGTSNVFLGRDGEIVFSKNNVCVHESSDDHTPGYLTIHCLNDEHIGVTLVLQWLPNIILQKNPSRCVSPRNKCSDEKDSASNSNQDLKSNEVEINNVKVGSDEVVLPPPIQYQTVRVNGDTPSDRPTMLNNLGGGDLAVPNINVIPNTPVDPRRLLDDYDEVAEYTRRITAQRRTSESKDSESQGSGETSGADEEKDEDIEESSPDESDEEANRFKSITLETYRKNCANFMSKTPEQFAQEHNLILDTGGSKTDDARLAMANNRVLFQQKPTTSTSLFSVNLGKMRTARLFYSNPECTSGQLVIASLDSQYKILHFHHGGLDKLAKLLEQWNAIKSKSVKDSPIPDKQLLICHPEVSRTELDPEDGIYDKVTWEFWRMYRNEDGSIDDYVTIRKLIYFSSMDPSLRKELWPFLLRVYTWNSTSEQRELIRNDLFLEYQNIKKKRINKMNSSKNAQLVNVECTIVKDVVRTDRRNPFFAGDMNPNLDVMKDILLNYAYVYPSINYIQDAYWCFAGLMNQTLFCTTTSAEMNMMEVNLEYLRELLKLLEPKFFTYLCGLGGDALQLMFVHRWLLLFFKREFPESDALHIWEACWSRYRTSYFHLFVALSIISIYTPDIIAQGLPHDEILLYFSSLAMHMDANVVLKKARGLLYQFYRLERIPCTLAGVCEVDSNNEQWTSHTPHHNFICTKVHGTGGEQCPFAT